MSVPSLTKVNDREHILHSKEKQEVWAALPELCTEILRAGLTDGLYLPMRNYLCSFLMIAFVLSFIKSELLREWFGNQRCAPLPHVCKHVYI